MPEFPWPSALLRGGGNGSDYEARSEWIKRGPREGRCTRTHIIRNAAANSSTRAASAAVPMFVSSTQARSYLLLKVSQLLLL